MTRGVVEGHHDAPVVVTAQGRPRHLDEQVAPAVVGDVGVQQLPEVNLRAIRHRVLGDGRLLVGEARGALPECNDLGGELAQDALLVIPDSVGHEDQGRVIALAHAVLPTRRHVVQLLDEVLLPVAVHGAHDLLTPQVNLPVANLAVNSLVGVVHSEHALRGRLVHGLLDADHADDLLREHQLGGLHGVDALEPRPAKAPAVNLARLRIGWRLGQVDPRHEGVRHLDHDIRESGQAITRAVAQHIAHHIAKRLVIVLPAVQVVRVVRLALIPLVVRTPPLHLIFCLRVRYLKNGR